jgi:polyisoprenoid-binding protein YceI|tara:strand:+ start:1080 stop:1655 length:576 start_codon:yes stop_codon:yes gene_type:complete
MKKALLCIALVLGFTSVTLAQQKLTINTKKSHIKWSCDYAFYFNGHYGMVYFKDGYFIKTLDKITGGTFTIDLNSIVTQDMDTEKANAGLTEHLKNEDFFYVKQYPTATLTIKDTEYINSKTIKVSAYLTIKSITNPISFKADLDYEKATMHAKFKIDRTEWQINYGSKSTDQLKNSVISDAIGFDVLISL